MIKLKKIVLSCECPKCKNSMDIEASPEQYMKYVENRDSIQDVFPELKREDRERLITGICPECWNKMFKKNED
jgi:ssDNA-binding Zn-finger/Zn-ribbon topoisomerase 1